MVKKAPRSTAPPTRQRDLEFLFEVGCMRYIPRSWVQFLGADFANLSEHIFRVTWIALMIAQGEGSVDTGKLVKMALVHDLAESRGVDVHYVSREFADRHEDRALSATLEGTSLADEFKSLAEEYEHRQSLEAKIVKDADNLDVDFELAEQAARGVTLKQAFGPMRQHVGQTKLYTETARQLWHDLQTAEPHAWHLNSSNRFTTGDWKKS